VVGLESGVELVARHPAVLQWLVRQGAVSYRWLPMVAPAHSCIWSSYDTTVQSRDWIKQAMASRAPLQCSGGGGPIMCPTMTPTRKIAGMVTSCCNTAAGTALRLA
jgi:hypothetical protein